MPGLISRFCTAVRDREDGAGDTPGGLFFMFVMTHTTLIDSQLKADRTGLNPDC
jgi:hypothetical protein